MTRVTGLMILAAVVFSGVMVGCAADKANTGVARLNSPAPDFHLQNLEGQEVSLSDFRGRPVLLNFWASWCGPCRGEMPFIQGVFEDEEWSDRGLVILAVNVGEGPASVLRFVEEFHLSFPVLLDTSQDTARQYNIRGIPATFFIDKNGIIKDMKVGAFASQEEIDWRLINSILEGE